MEAYRPTLPPRLGYVERNGKYHPVNTQGIAIEQSTVRHEEAGERLDATEEKLETTEEYLGDIVSSMDFSVSERMKIKLVQLPARLFPQYVPDTNRNYDRGEAFADGDVNKWMAQNNTRLDPNIPLHEQPNLQLFRDGNGDYEYFPGEGCLRGFRRRFENVNRPEENGVYEVTVNYVDSKTPPPNDYQSWKKI